MHLKTFPEYVRGDKTCVDMRLAAIVVFLSAMMPARAVGGASGGGVPSAVIAVLSLPPSSGESSACNGARHAVRCGVCVF